MFFIFQGFIAKYLHKSFKERTFEKFRVASTQTRKTTSANDDVIKNWNLQNLSRCAENPRNRHIFGTGFQRTGRMIMNKNNGNGAVFDCKSKGFARMHGSLVDKPRRKFMDPYNIIRRVQRNDHEMFLRLVLHIRNTR